MSFDGIWRNTLAARVGGLCRARHVSSHLSCAMALLIPSIYELSMSMRNPVWPTLHLDRSSVNSSSIHHHGPPAVTRRQGRASESRLRRGARLGTSIPLCVRKLGSSEVFNILVAMSGTWWPFNLGSPQQSSCPPFIIHTAIKSDDTMEEELPEPVPSHTPPACVYPQPALPLLLSYAILAIIMTGRSDHIHPLARALT